jgi:predicted transposase YbfD/YdcC
MESKKILEHFRDFPDPREDNRRHLLLDIIAIVLCASVCGAENWDDIEAFGVAKQEWLASFLELPHGIPGSDTYRRVFARLDSREFHRRFFAWLAVINPRLKGEIVSIDGKTGGHSADAMKGKSAIHIVSAWANKAGLTLGQIKVDEKSNEISAIPELLDSLDVQDSIVTIDAIGTQKAIAEKIIDGGADYVLALKGNQGTLQEDVELYFKGATAAQLQEPPFVYHRSFDKDHGRRETRQYWVSDDIGWLSMKEEWKGLKTLCMVRSQRSIGAQTTSETRYYISSLAADAQALAGAIRGHWAVENSLHWVLDVAFREDESRKRKDNSAENFATLRHITLNLLKKEKTSKRSIAGKRLLAGWDTSYLQKVLALG